MYRVVKRSEAPSYVTFPYILTGYRVGGDSLRCLQSLFEWHAETVNAWSMIGATLVNIALLATMERSVPNILLASTVVVQTPVSVGFHLFRGINRESYQLWRKLDQSFIYINSVLLSIAFSITVYEGWLPIVATGLCTSTVAATACYEIVGRPFHVQRNRILICATTGSIVVCYLSPIVYWTLTTGEWFHLTGIVFSILAGGILFATSFPERMWPGRFDRIGSSHQLMHLFALVANLFEWSFIGSI